MSVLQCSPSQELQAGRDTTIRLSTVYQDTSNDSTLSLIFTLSVGDRFTQSDITIGGGGELSSFVKFSDTEYTATFFQNSTASYVQIGEGACRDSNGVRYSSAYLKETMSNVEADDSELLESFAVTHCDAHESCVGYEVFYVNGVNTRTEIRFDGNAILPNSRWGSWSSGGAGSVVSAPGTDRQCYAKASMSTTPSPSLNHSLVVNSNMFQDKAGNGNLASNIFEWTTIEPVYVIMGRCN